MTILEIPSTNLTQAMVSTSLSTSRPPAQGNENISITTTVGDKRDKQQQKSDFPISMQNKRL